MRDRGAPPPQQPKRKKPSGLPPLDPKGFAVDLTPSTKRVSKEARGAAMISRGTFERYLREHDPKKQLGPGQKKAVQLLAQNRNSLLKPENSKYLSAIQRAQPGDKLHSAIHADPHTADQYRLLKAGVSLSPASRLTLQKQGLNNEQIDRFAAGDITAERALKLGHVARAQTGAQAARALEKKAGLKPGTVKYNPSTSELFQAKTQGDWMGRLFGGAEEAVLGMPAFGYHMATTDPRKSIPEAGAAIGESFKESVTHPLRQFREDPFSFLSNLATVGSLGVGAGLRASSAAGEVGARLSTESAARAAARGFLNPEYRGPLGLMEKRNIGGMGKRVAKQEANLAERINQVRENMDAAPEQGQLALAGMDHPHAEPPKGWRAIKAEIKATRETDRQNIADRLQNPEHNPAFVKWVSHAGVAGRELLDGVRAGTIYLRPAYIPNNWAGNTFMNLVHQGAYAPINLAKSVVLYKHIPKEDLQLLREATGAHALQAHLQFRGRGYARAVFDPVARKMGAIGDQPFRDAALLHELRRVGVKNIADVKKLAARVRAGDQDAVRTLARTGNKAQEEIVKFNKLTSAEQNVIQRVFFVYNWVKGATRYAARFPLAHPIQSGIYGTGGRTIGQQYVNEKMGGLPPYLAGVLPIGGGRAVNPFGISPLGTGVDVGRAVQGTAKEFFPSMFGQYDPHTMEDWTSLLGPVPSAGIQARENVGGRTFFQNIYRNIGAYRLYHGLTQPGTGSTYPGTRKEALGSFIFGSLYPRKYDPQAIQQALERMNINHPEALIDGMKKRYREKMGEPVPPEIEAAYRKDLKELKAQKDFKSDYAHSHGSSSYRKLPPINRAEAALKYVRDHHFLPAVDLADFQAAIDQATTDDEAKAIESGLWATTNVGAGKEAWNNLMAPIKAGQLTRKK